MYETCVPLLSIPEISTCPLKLLLLRSLHHWKNLMNIYITHKYVQWCLFGFLVFLGFLQIMQSMIKIEWLWNLSLHHVCPRLNWSFVFILWAWTSEKVPSTQFEGRIENSKTTNQEDVEAVVLYFWILRGFQQIMDMRPQNYFDLSTFLKQKVEVR